MPFSAKRRFPRMRLKRPALVRTLQTDPLQEPFEDFTNALVLGAGGCMLEAPEPLGFGALTEVHIALGGQVVKADGRVVWEKPALSGRHQVGLEFVRISPDDREVIEALVARARRASGPEWSPDLPQA